MLLCCFSVALEAPRPFHLGFWERREPHTDQLGCPLLAAHAEEEGEELTDSSGTRGSAPDKAHKSHL